MGRLPTSYDFNSMRYVITKSAYLYGAEDTEAKQKLLDFQHLTKDQQIRLTIGAASSSISCVLSLVLNLLQ